MHISDCAWTTGSFLSKLKKNTLLNLPAVYAGVARFIVFGIGRFPTFVIPITRVVRIERLCIRWRFCFWILFLEQFTSNLPAWSNASDITSSAKLFGDLPFTLISAQIVCLWSPLFLFCSLFLPANRLILEGNILE